MQPMPHQLMGYDRAITMFSPDGRLLQVEYAKKTVKQGTTAMGMICKDGIVLIADKRIIDKLMLPESIEKIFQIDDHMGATVSGLVSDGRILIERAQLTAQQHKVTYDAPIDVIEIVKDISDLKQLCTQSGGLRPFGVSLMIAGIDNDGPKLYMTEPSGIYFSYKATAMGEGETEILDILNKEYKDTIKVEEAIKLGIKSLKKVLDANFNADRIDAAYIMTDDKMFRRVTKSKIKDYLK
jgi:proteasome alpha subunit